jgi:hypothetical protein
MQSDMHSPSDDVSVLQANATAILSIDDNLDGTYTYDFFTTLLNRARHCSSNPGCLAECACARIQTGHAAERSSSPCVQ